MHRFLSRLQNRFPAWVLGVQAPVAALILLYLRAGHPYYRLFPLLLAAGAFLFALDAFSGRWAAWVAPVYYFGLISLLSSATTTTARPVMSFLFHPPEYFFLALLGMHAARSPGFLRGLRRDAAVLAGCVLLAALDEFHQSFVPGRVADVFDGFLDASGAAAGILAYRVLSHLGGWERSSGVCAAERDKPCK